MCGRKVDELKTQIAEAKDAFEALVAEGETPEATATQVAELLAIIETRRQALRRWQQRLRVADVELARRGHGPTSTRRASAVSVGGADSP